MLRQAFIKVKVNLCSPFIPRDLLKQGGETCGIITRYTNENYINEKNESNYKSNGNGFSCKVKPCRAER